MNVLRVVRSMDPSGGGVAEAIRQTAFALARSGHGCEVVSMDDPESPWLGKGDMRTIGLGNALSAYGYSPRLIPWLRANESWFDLVIVDGLWLYPTQAVRRALRGANRGYYVMPHGMLDPWFQRDPSRRIKAIRNIVYWHALERGVVNEADGVLFTCEQERLLARKSFSGYHPHTEHVVGLGIEEPPEWSAAMATAIQNVAPRLVDDGYLLYLGRLHPKKGVDLLLRAYGELAGGLGRGSRNRAGVPRERVPPLVVAGPPVSHAYREELLSLAGSEGLRVLGTTESPVDARSPGSDGDPSGARVCFLPEVSGLAKWGLIRRAGALVLPSHQENFGLTVVEAMACEKPVLISDKVNIYREIDGDGAGFIAPDTLEGAIHLIERWSALGDRERDAMGSVARASFRNRFHIAAAARSIAELAVSQRSGGA